MRKKIVIIGGGPAALMAAAQLSLQHEVHIYEKEKMVGRKFLVAGKGGFNLTHDIEKNDLIQKYLPASFLKESLLYFDTKALRHWLSAINIPTFTGTSHRIFPEKGIKPIQVLQQIKHKLQQQGVNIHVRHQFIGFNTQYQPIIQHQEQEFSPTADHYIFALGGASWSKTGSDGQWTIAFQRIGVQVLPFQASNCGLHVAWPKHFLQHHEGKPLKNLKVNSGHFQAKGEAMITKYGLEGNAIYPVVPAIRTALNEQVPAFIHLDLKPFNTIAQLSKKWPTHGKGTKDYAHFFRLSSVQMALLKAYTNKENFLSPTLFVQKIKNLPLPVTTLRPLEEAISSVGGIALDELNSDFSLKKHPHIYTVGEMVNWDAPTGGFLLQACFSMGVWVARCMNEN